VQRLAGDAHRPLDGLRADRRPAQHFLDRLGPRRHLGHRPDADAQIVVALAGLIQAHPGRAAQDGQGDALRAHDALEGAALAPAAQPEAEANQQIARLIQTRLPRPDKEIAQGQPLPHAIEGDIGLGVEGDQRGRAVPGGQGVGHVAAESAHVAHLRPADHAAAFDQAGRPRRQDWLGHDLGVGHARAEGHHVTVLAQGGDAGDAGDVHQSIGPGHVPVPNVQQQVGATGDDAGAALVAGQ